MKDIRITEPRQIIKHEILCPKGDLERKKVGEKENGRQNFGRYGKKQKEEKKMPQNQSTVEDRNFD